MSTAEAFWMSVGASGRLVELSRDECLELLGAMSVGRIAYTTDDGPRVFPVNYILEGDGVIFRTVPDVRSSATRWRPPARSRSTRSTSSTSRAGACWPSVACTC
jgi:Pyridoxamine 5'-phosphate oxidase